VSKTPRAAVKKSEAANKVAPSKKQIDVAISLPNSPDETRSKKKTKLSHESKPTITTTTVPETPPIVQNTPIRPVTNNEADVISDIGSVVSVNSYLLCEPKWKVSKLLSRYQEILLQFELQQKQLQEQKEEKAKEQEQKDKDTKTEDTNMDDIMDYYLEEEEEEVNNTESTVYSDKELQTLLKDNFGYSHFRDGQLECIKRINNLKSTLLILPTGSGKSLCYQFPVLLLPKHTIIIVISPLLSLINDQLNQLPHCVSAATINSQQSVINYNTFLHLHNYF
jgi:exonuclease VII large subunit